MSRYQTRQHSVMCRSTRGRPSHGSQQGHEDPPTVGLLERRDLLRRQHGVECLRGLQRRRVSKRQDHARHVAQFNCNNANNPFRNCSWLCIPYCTGDLHNTERVRSCNDNGGRSRRSSSARASSKCSYGAS
jgi:hypothetical protein